MRALHAFSDLALAFLERTCLLGELAHVLRDARVARILDAAGGAVELLDRCLPLRLRTARGLLHRVGGPLHLLCGLLQFWRLLLARQALEAASLLLGLAREVALRATTTAATLPAHSLAHRLGLPLQAFVLLLLARRELPEPLQRLVHGLRLAFGRLRLHGLILILLAVVLEGEEVGQILSTLSTAPATTAAARLLAALHLDVAIHRVGAL